ncbi:MAG: choice-of-anchor B family protein [Bacteroidetes bacterium]|nr:choice-of-anchor B family protein [Bacteroidota bacterium]
MKKLLLVFSGILLTLATQAQLNVSLRSNLQYPNDALSNIGGYVDSLGNEYALVGYESGLSIVNVTDPANPVIAFSVPGTPSTWREVKTWQNYAYVTTEGCCDGLQIINLGYLPDSISVKQWKGNGAINGDLETIHALHIEDAHAYLFGSNLFNGAGIIVDLADPWNPNYKGYTPGTYIHDGYVRNDVLYSAHIYDGYFSVFDVSNKANPVLLATQSTPTQFTHNTWLNDAGTVLFTTDENTNSYLGAYDITNLNNIIELDRIQLTPGSGSIIHNTHTLNDFEIVSWYKDGIAIVDVSRPENMIVTGSYDTYPQGVGNGFSGAWGVYPYLPSGNLVVSDINNGLFVLTPTYIRGCYLEGMVTDSVTGLPLNNVSVTIIGPSITNASKITGEYKTGLADAGTYDVSFSKAGYTTKTINNVVLQNGILTVLDVELNTIFPTVTISGSVVEAGTGNPIPNATVLFTSPQFDNTLTSDANGLFTIAGFFPGTYDVLAGNWGHRTYCSSGQNVSGGSNINIVLDKGYYDDFALDFGWTVSGPSGNEWEIDVPVSTTNNGQTANPGADVATDCSDKAFVTDNGGGGPWDNDVDQGNTILTSPVFDATQYSNPYVKYNRWFYNGGNTNASPDDSMKIFLDNGTTIALLESFGPSGSASQWQLSNYKISDFNTPTATMQLIVQVGDPGPIFNIVEGGLDKFEVVEVTGISTGDFAEAGLGVFPNPFIKETTIKITNLKTDRAILQVFDMQGRLIESRMINGKNTLLTIGNSWLPGIYMVRMMNENGESEATRVVKQ